MQSNCRNLMPDYCVNGGDPTSASEFTASSRREAADMTGSQADELCMRSGLRKSSNISSLKISTGKSKSPFSMILQAFSVLLEKPCFSEYTQRSCK